MGLSNFPSPAEGMLPVLVMNTVMSVAILKNLLRSILDLMGAVNWVSTEENSPTTEIYHNHQKRMRGISITQFKYLCDSNGKNCCRSGNSKTSLEGRTTVLQCCVCLCRFEEEEEVSELSCKHFFHRNCLEKWFDNQHSTCPLCRSLH